MNIPYLLVDFNEMVDSDTVLLSSDDKKIDFEGNEILLEEGQKVFVYMPDIDEQGNFDTLAAQGTVVKNSYDVVWTQKAKWVCKIDNNGIRHKSEILDNGV